MMITGVLCTARNEPQFGWMADSLVRNLNANPKVDFELLVIDKLLWTDVGERRDQLADAVSGRFSFRHVPPKPSPWQGPWRKTKRDFYALTDARNTGVIMARGKHIVHLDDCSVLGDQWLHWHARAAERNIAAAGSFQSWNTAKVENGVVTSNDPHPSGDSRGSEIRRASGGWMWGLNNSYPLDWALRINGHDEHYSGQGGSEDCLEFFTEVLTDEGLRPIGQLVGQEVTLLTSSKKWVKAPIKKASSTRRLWKVTCSNGRGHSKELFCTDNHKWFVKNYADKAERNVHVVATSQLQPENHRLAYQLANSALKTKTIPSRFGIAHGIAFGDGCNEKGKTSGKVALYGEKRELSEYFPGCSQYDTKCEGVVFSGLPDYFKAVPSLRENTSYLLGWVMGYFATDGSVSEAGSASLSSTSYEDIDSFRNACLILGIECYDIRTQVRDTNFKSDSTLYKVTLGQHSLNKEFFLRSKHRERFVENDETEYMTSKLNEWKVVSVETTDRVEDVYCAVVPETHAFVIEGNILTHNCDFGVRLERAGCPIVYFPECIVHQILETHEAVCEHNGWGRPQPRPQKERQLKDGKMHFANELLIEKLFEDPKRIHPLVNRDDLTKLREKFLSEGYGAFPTTFGGIAHDWRDGQPLEEMD